MKLCSLFDGSGATDFAAEHLGSDGAQYRLWGNGMALPCVLYVLEGVKEILEEV